MKSIKRFFIGMFSVALLATLFAAPAYAKSGTYVFDEQDVLTDSKFQELEQMGADYAAQYGVGVYLVYTDYMNGKTDPSSSERNEFGRQFFLQHDLGVGSGDNGIICAIAVKSRDYVTVKHFDNSSEDPFSDAGVDALEDAYTDPLHDSDWYEGGKAYYKTVGEQLSYFATTGKQWTEPDLLGFILKLLAALGIPGFIAASSIKRDKNAMQTAREQSEAGNYLDEGSLAFSVSTDDFVNTTLAVVPIPKNDNDSGSSGWSDMGGGFSGSGGGKF
ncbi:MAG: TPM domain-containing protein [Coriobacteriaceae bacterium]|jgi:uncharacterized membrane protein YgcG|nr:TPM domain-containing protein [Coriobacteriaceae bacterium]